MSQSRTAGQDAADRQAALYRETDVRFWAQTGYKIGRRLDPNDPADAAYVPVWRAICERVLAEQRAHGWATPTHRSEAVTGPLTQAAAASARADQHARAAADATAAGAAAASDQHLKAAERAHEDAHAHAQAAAAAQPPSVSPDLVRESSLRAEHGIQGIPGSLPSDLSPEQRLELARKAIADALEVANALKRATSSPPAPQLPPSTTTPTRDAAATPSGVAPGAQAELDDRGRVKQPSAAPSPGSRWWGVVAVGTLCVGAFVGAAALSMKSGRRRSRRTPRRATVATDGDR